MPRIKDGPEVENLCWICLQVAFVCQTRQRRN